MRVLVADLERYEADGWRPAERFGAVTYTLIHGGAVAVCLVWRESSR